MDTALFALRSLLGKRFHVTYWILGKRAGVKILLSLTYL